MKQVVILYDIDDWNQSSPFKKNKGYKGGYEKLYSMAEKQGIRFVRAFIGWYTKKNVFSKAWGFDVKKRKWIKLKNVKVDFAYDKLDFKKKYFKLKKRIIKDMGILNNIKMSYKLGNKNTVFNMFKDLVPKTVFIRNQAELKKKINKIKTERAVLKPISGSGGEGIIIEYKNKLLAGLKKQKNKKPKYRLKGKYILQEFIDTSEGVKGLIKGVHDLRVIMINNKVIYSYFRTPKKGKLLCNVNKGGTVHNIKNSQIPKSALSIVKKIDNALKIYYPRVYTVDLFFNKNKPYVVELNSMPGLSYDKGEEKLIEPFYSELIKAVKQGINKKQKN